MIGIIKKRLILDKGSILRGFNLGLRLFILLIVIYPQTLLSGDGEGNTFFHMVINRPPDAPLYKKVELIYSEVFRRLDITLVLSYQPLLRASVNLDKGKSDGEPARIYSYGDHFDNLVRVDEPIFNMIVAAYKKGKKIPEMDGWSSLLGTKYSVDYPNGMKICEVNLSKVVSEDRLSSVHETSQGLLKLHFGRTDIYVDDQNSIIPELKSSNYEIYLAGIMEEVPLYMFVHKRHIDLVEKLERVIKDIKSEGLVEVYHKKAFGIEE